MKRLLFSLFILLGLSASAADVDYRSLGTNAFFTNGFIVNSKHWTNTSVGIATVISPVFTDRTIYNDNSGANYQGLSVSLFNTGADTFTLGGYLFNSSTNSAAKAAYYSDGAYGGIFEVAPTSLGVIKNGDGVGALGVADGKWSKQIGVAGLGVSTVNGQTNIGVFGSALSAGTTGGGRVGGYFETGTQTQGAITDPIITNSVIQANSRSGDFVFRGQTNGASTIQVRPDGSMFLGKNVDQDVSLNDYSKMEQSYAVSMVDSNEASQIRINSWAIDSENYNFYGHYGLLANANKDNGVSFLSLETRNTNGAKTGIEIEARPLSDDNNAIGVLSSGNQKFKVNQVGDLRLIKGVAYLWPSSQGGVSTVLQNDGSGTLSWATKQFGVGPGTNNYISKFNSTGTNVVNSPVKSAFTNSVEFFLTADSTSFTNSGTNRMYGEWTNAGTNQWLEIVTPKGHNNEAAHIRTMAIGQASQRAPLYLQDGWAVEPDTNMFVGHGTASSIYPLFDNVSTFGSSSLRVKGGSFGTQGVDISTPSDLSAGALRIGSGGAGGGISGDANSLSFFRPTTGVTAAFDRYNNLFIFDLSGNTIGFGSGLSNCISFIGHSAITGLIQVGTNTGVVAPATAGIVGGQASGANFGGSDLRLVGGPSTGTGTNGNVRIQTAEKALASSSSLNSSFKDRFFTIADPMILTTNSATTVFSFTVPTTLKAAGVTVFAHTEIENGTDIAATDEHFLVNAVNKAGTLTVSTPSAPLTTTSSSGGSAAIANTWSAAATGTRVDVKLTCVTSGINSTNSTVRVTLIPNSSAIPVITHP